MAGGYQDLVQSCVGDHHAEQGEKSRPGRRGEPGEQGVEVGAARAEQAHAGVEAGDDKDSCQDRSAPGAEDGSHQIGHGSGPVGGPGKGTAGQRPDMGQHGVD